MLTRDGAHPADARQWSGANGQKIATRLKTEHYKPR